MLIPQEETRPVWLSVQTKALRERVAEIGLTERGIGKPKSRVFGGRIDGLGCSQTSGTSRRAACSMSSMRSPAVLSLVLWTLACQRGPVRESTAAPRPVSIASPVPAAPGLTLTATHSAYPAPSAITLLFTNSGSSPIYLQPLWPRATALLERYNDVLHSWEQQPSPLYCATGMLKFGPAVVPPGATVAVPVLWTDAFITTSDGPFFKAGLTATEPLSGLYRALLQVSADRSFRLGSVALVHSQPFRLGV